MDIAAVMVPDAIILVNMWGKKTPVLFKIKIKIKALSWELGQSQEGQNDKTIRGHVWMSYRKIKRIAMDWQWVTPISWCQMKNDSHSSPVMHRVDGKTHTTLEKLKILVGKWTFFGHFFVRYFQIICVDICIFLNKNDWNPILHTCLCWSFLSSTVGHLVVSLCFGLCKLKEINKTVKLVS